MSTINGSNHIDINQRLPKFEGFDETATDFAEQIDRAIEQYSDVLNYAKEVTDEKIRLQKQNEIMREALKSILESEDTLDKEDAGTNAIVKYNTLYLKNEARKALKQVKEIEG